MAKRQLTIIFPQQLIKEPVIYTMAREYNVIPNIRRAKVTESVGEMTLELEGDAQQLARAVAYLEQKGLKVEPVTGDIIS